jgi:hypothetical protein
MDGWLAGNQRGIKRKKNLTEGGRKCWRRERRNEQKEQKKTSSGSEVSYGPE